MKREYVAPETEVIRYNVEDVILTSSNHHCGIGVLTDHEYVDTTGDSYCDTDENYHCNGGSGDVICDEHTEGCSGDCNGYVQCDNDIET